MPSLARKLLISAAVDGLILQPLHTHKGAEKRERSGAVKLHYKSAAISPVTPSSSHASPPSLPEDAKSKSFEAFGIVGLLTVSTSSFLISITKREQVAQIHGKPVYVITEVACTPLASRAEAQKSVEITAAELRRKSDGSGSDTESDTDDERELTATSDTDDVEDEDKPARKTPSHERKSSVAEDVIRNRGGYGRFAQKWFSKNGWAADRKRGLGLSGSESPDAGPQRSSAADKKDDGDIPNSYLDYGSEENDSSQDSATSLIPKLLRTTSLLFGSSKSFFFSYDHDLTRSYANRKTAGLDSVLYKEVDPLFFWNRSVIKPFIDAKQDALVLPLMQGFVGQREFTVEPHPKLETAEDELEMTDWTPEPRVVDASKSADATNQNGKEDAVGVTWMSKSDDTRSYLITLISRRSVKRAGLRYLRRGVDGDGNVANSVETEQILSSPDWTSSRPSYSFLQVRGSIPLFFSQSPYSFKPIPQMQQSAETNYEAFQKQFSFLNSRYGDVQVASLVEKHGPEKDIGEAYESNMKQLNEAGGLDGKKIRFEWFDFHAMCRGMKFENVSLLTDALGPVLDGFGYSSETDSQITQKQSGVLRTNCMDCLDRTNVAQSAFGRRALESQLKADGIDMLAQKDQTTQWFNTLWADNGDAISKQYASTAALKGDFTRTRKRNYKGALTDMGLSISRFYSGIVNDYFSQTAIDFLMGSVTWKVFEDFSTTLTPLDPSISTTSMRQRAIDASSRLVIADSTEELISAYTLLTPHTPNTIKSMPFEESVLLLTDKALYACRFDWNMEKVSSFERVNLAHITAIQYGVYIISTLSPAQSDEKTNFGLVIRYTAGENDIQRVNTRSISSMADGDLLEGSALNTANPSASAPTQPTATTPSPSSTAPEKIISLKALPSQTAIASSPDVDESKMSEMKQVEMIVGEIERLVRTARLATDAKSDLPALIANKSDIISLVEAKRSTGILETLGHSLKKLVWA